MTDDKEPLLLTAPEVAQIFGIGVRTLWNWERDGILRPATRICGRRYYARADVERLIRSGWL
ncbi:helix-turn-helix domain-containing protein [Neoroseomonas oryzicola]|uniref:Helix-turn-helix domain-containing protein n=1 Tax=Neoroseomonas oryzicola TaxID=535904 RepID=A0A9X9WJG0_9PROT|nr:helix-turn-helix domain-containing protein [Neoroseomonas oryzicola]NKE18238.1 helix-turn-helix domain-containing protein [Neoroseomonas oryzicola]